jgi:hypothetical protein
MPSNWFKELNRTVCLAIQGGWGHTARLIAIVTAMAICAAVLLVVR